MEQFSGETRNTFSFVYERILKPNETVIVKMPRVSANKRSVNDIGWACDNDDLKLYGTLSNHPESPTALWQEISAFDDINKTVAYLKIINADSVSRICIRAILC